MTCLWDRALDMRRRAERTGSRIAHLWADRMILKADDCNCGACCVDMFDESKASCPLCGDCLLVPTFEGVELSCDDCGIDLLTAFAGDCVILLEKREVM